MKTGRIVLPRKLRARLMELAVLEDRSFSYTIVYLISKGLMVHDQEERDRAEDEKERKSHA